MVLCFVGAFFSLLIGSVWGWNKCARYLNVLTITGESPAPTVGWTLITARGNIIQSVTNNAYAGSKVAVKLLIFLVVCMCVSMHAHARECKGSICVCTCMRLFMFACVWRHVRARVCGRVCELTCTTLGTTPLGIPTPTVPRTQRG